jgi:hypothetical protein
MILLVLGPFEYWKWPNLASIQRIQKPSLGWAFFSHVSSVFPNNKWLGWYLNNRL